MTASSSRPPSFGTRIAAGVVLVLLVFLVVAQSSSGPTPEVESVNPAGSVARDPDSTEPLGTAPAADLGALLDGLSLGNEFDGWKVVNFTATNEKIVWIEFGNASTFFSVGVNVRGKGNPPPPIQTERYEVGYGMVRPKGTTISQDMITKISEQVAARIRKREAEVAKPAAL